MDRYTVFAGVLVGILGLPSVSGCASGSTGDRGDGASPGAQPTNTIAAGGATAPPSAAGGTGSSTLPGNTFVPSGATSGTAGAGDVTGGAGVPAVSQGGSGGVAGAGIAGGGGSTVTTVEGPSMVDDQCDEPGAFDPLVSESADETCYDFRVHGRTGTTDSSKFSVINGESYNQFYYAIPWAPGSVSTRFGNNFDNKTVLHHWLMFAQQLGQTPGTVEPNVTGTTLFTDAELVAGWAVGGCTTRYPADVGVHLPETGVIMVQWHHFNTSGGPQQDASAAQICTVPAGTRPNTAGITFLGTELISVPGGSTAEGGGTCVNNSGGPIKIIGFSPHMHTIGINMKSEVMRKAGGSEVVFDMPFQFDYQTNYTMNPPVVLQPGDAITSTCRWKNDSAAAVGFGQSTTQEMCYQFALAYPYGALNNGVLSLIGATNTCW